MMISFLQSIELLETRKIMWVIMNLHNFIVMGVWGLAPRNE